MHLIMTTIDFGRVPKTKPYLFADALEIWAGLSNHGPVSKTDAHSLILTSVTDATELLDIDEPDLDDNEYPDGDSGSEISSREQRYIDECYRQLEYRINEFSDVYPFTLQSEVLKLKDDLSDLNMLYLFLLLASRSRTFGGNRGLTQRIANVFEEVCKDSLQKLMNSDARVIMFGPTSEDRGALFDSNLRRALPKLASFMGMTMAPDWSPSAEKAQGDGKIDLVGVQRLDQAQGGWNVFIGQCAAMEEEKNWEPKRAQADIKFHASRFHFTVPAQAVMFIPVCFRQPDGLWVNKGSADNVILMDRVRILRNFGGDEDSVEKVREFIQREFAIGEMTTAAA